MNTERPRHYFGFNCTICETFVMTENAEWACFCPRCYQHQQPDLRIGCGRLDRGKLGGGLASPPVPFQDIKNAVPSPEQQPIIGMARIVDSVLVDDNGPDQSTEL